MWFVVFETFDSVTLSLAVVLRRSGGSSTSDLTKAPVHELTQ
jgi:hypothetical protein